MDNSGYIRWEPTEDELNEFYAGPYCGSFPALKENEYLLIEDKNSQVIDYYKSQNNEVKKVLFPTIGDKQTNIYKPRNEEQYCAFDLLNDTNVPVKVLTGAYGSGKTLITVVKALELLNKGAIQKIIWVRQPIIAKDTEEIGFLKGSMTEKLMPYAAPLVDKIGSLMAFEELVADERIEVCNIGFIRGRSFSNAVVLCSEAQNLTEGLIKLLLTRIEDSSQLWLEGDIDGQQDKAVYEKHSGLRAMIGCLSGKPEFGHIHLAKNERGKIARLVENFSSEQ